MDSLSITDSETEFYLDDQKIYFLENLSRINLFIGANNSRKSRFLRKIISSDSRVVISSEAHLNTAFIKGLQLPGEITEKFEGSFNEDLLVFAQKNHPPQDGKRFCDIERYFDSRNDNNKNSLSFKILVDHISSVNQTLIGIRTEDNIKSLLQEIKFVADAVDLLVYLYEQRADMAKLANYLSHPNTWPEENLSAIRFSFPDGKVDGNTDEKLAMLKRIRTYFVYLKAINASIGSNYLVYIPVLRSARALYGNNNQMVYDDIFKTTIHFQYFDNKLSNSGDAIFTGQNFYAQITKLKSGKNSERQEFREFEKFIGLSFFQSDDICFTPYHDSTGAKKEITVDLPDERKDVAIQDLGDGVQAIINLFFPIFTARQDSWVFIDEPELNLHPGFQNLFIRTLLENDYLKAKNLRYFINTHSNHILSELLLAGASQSEVFVFNRKSQDASNIKPFKGFESATLELLGVLNTSTLISNCSVWVEGITDRLYIRAYLTAYMKAIQSAELMEGLNYTFVEYGGKNLIHYLFDDKSEIGTYNDGIKAFFVSSRIFLIADADENKDKQHQFYKTLEKGNRFCYMETKYPEIENLIPPKILSKFLQDKLNITTNVADVISNCSYKKTKLGKFLATQFSKHGITRKIEAKYGGTLRSDYKSQLADYVINGVQNGNITWQDLSTNEIVADIITRMYQFIKVNNK